MTAVDADRRLTRGILAIATIGGAAGWVLIGSIWGAIGIWVAIGIVLLVMAATAMLLGAGDA